MVPGSITRAAVQCRQRQGGEGVECGPAGQGLCGQLQGTHREGEALGLSHLVYQLSDFRT